MLISVDEFRRYLGGYEPTEGLMLEMIKILEGVQQQLELYLNRPVELVQVREVAITNSRGHLYLTKTPVHKIISYGRDTGLATTPAVVTTPYTMVEDPMIGVEGRMIDKVNLKHYSSNSSPAGIANAWPFTRYLVEYIAGIDGTQHEDIKLAIKRVAAREYVQGHVDTAGLRQGQVEDTETGDSRNPGWTIGELKAFERYRRRILL